MMVNRSNATDRYNNTIEGYLWLQYHKDRVYDASIDLAVKRKLEGLNNKERVSYLEIQGLKSGRDVVSGYTWYDIRKRVQPQTVELVKQLFSLDKHRLLMLRWICRGASVYVAFCKVIEAETAIQINRPRARRN